MWTSNAIKMIKVGDITVVVTPDTSRHLAASPAYKSNGFGPPHKLTKTTSRRVPLDVAYIATAYIDCIDRGKGRNNRVLAW